MADFWKGVIAGAVCMLVLVGVIGLFRFFNERDSELFETWEQQKNVETLQEDVRNRDPAEFLDDPGVRGAADGARDEYYRKLDEIIQRYRSSGVD